MKRIILILLLGIVACKNTTQKEVQPTSKVEVTKPTFYAKENCILFLQPSEEYFKTYLKDEEGIAETDSDFRYYTNEFYKEFEETYKMYFVEQRRVVLVNTKKDTVFIDRDKEELDYGVIIQQNDSIQILDGVNTDIDIKMALGIFNPNELQ